MRLKYHFECVELEDEYIYVPIGESATDIHGVLKLNNSGHEIMSMLKEGYSVDQIIDLLAKKYEDDHNTIKQNVEGVINTLVELKLLEDN